MSHIQTLSEFKNTCDATGNCTEYHALLQKEENTIDLITAKANQSALTWGVLIGIIGVILLATPFIKPLQRLQRASLPKIVVILPVILGLAIGFFVGFAVSFSACYKQECSPLENTAMFTIPAASLLVSVPLAVFLNKKRQGIEVGVSKINPVGWIIAGLVFVIFAFYKTVSTISLNNKSNLTQKSYLRNLER